MLTISTRQTETRVTNNSLFKSAYQETTVPLSSPSSGDSSEFNPIPKLQELLDDQVPNGSPFCKSSFVSYLASKHCLENLEFYYELTNFISKCSEFSEECKCDKNVQPIQHEWNCLFKDFIETNCPKEVNIPGDLKDEVDSLNCVPDIKSLNKLLKITKSHLHASYHEFKSDMFYSTSPDPIDTQAFNFDQQYTCQQGRSGSPMSLEEPTLPVLGRANFSFPLNPQNDVVNRTRRNFSTSAAVLSNSNSNSSAWNKIGRKFKWRRSSSSSA